ncbi:hypothetical protein JTE90_010451 [Oedothorax gibbosus]|uniref:Uncharacterized protein n=1 Tax=Oedothorax gibbosus TaxID=931172 RepID=A0AAV6W5M0_9ARAC|nr:hypothetical protein JTE90_010451 [Oedothorax gibbosus]
MSQIRFGHYIHTVKRAYNGLCRVPEDPGWQILAVYEHQLGYFSEIGNPVYVCNESIRKRMRPLVHYARLLQLISRRLKPRNSEMAADSAEIEALCEVMNRQG